MIRLFMSTAVTTLATLFVSLQAAMASVPFELPPVLIGDGLQQPRMSAIGDIDGDGDLDIVTVDQSGGRVIWFENRLNEGLGWQEWTIDDDIESPVSVALGDVTGDGRLDVVVSAWNSTPTGTSVAWYRNDGNPATNDGWAQQITASGLFLTQAIGIADINGNGRKDIVAAAARAQTGPFEFVWFENVLFEGATTILDDNAHIIDDNLPGISSLAIGDITRNGQLEVAVSVTFPAPGNQQRLIGYYEHNGDPTDGPWTQVAIDDDFPNAWRVALADLTGDGALDVIGLSDGQNRVTPYFNSGGDGSLWTPGTTLTINAPDNMRAVDVNQNGLIDILVSTHGATGGDRVVWFENDGAGGFTERPILSVGSEVQFQASAADIRGDGDPDIVVTSAIDGTISLVENATIHRNAVFNRPSTAVGASFGEGGDVLAADLNRDGQPDLVAASPQQGIVRGWANDNDGADWTGANIATGLTGVGPLASGDLSRNGFREVVAAVPVSGRIEAFRSLNAAATDWSGATVSNSYPRVSDVAVADVAGNGRLDIVAASPDAAVGDIVWFENQDGSGLNWAFPQTILANQPGSPDAGVARRIAVGDVTASALPDAVSGLTGIEGLTLHRNNGGASFTTVVIDAQFALADRPVIADVDRDGAPDVIAVGRFNGGSLELAWFRNEDGDGSAWQRNTIATGSGAFALLAVADFTQDGFADILARTPTPTLYANDGGTGFNAAAQAPFDLTGRVAVADFDRSGDLDAAGMRAGTGGANGLDLGWFENGGGQFGFDTEDIAASALADNATGPLLGITALHLGREADSDIQITSLALRFETEAGDPYANADLSSLLSSVQLYLDNGDGMFDPLTDSLLETVNVFDLNDGVETIDFAPNDPDMRVAFGETPQYWVVATAQPDGSDGLPTPRFRVRHLTENTSTAIDAESDLALSMAFTPNVASSVVQVIDPATSPLITLLGANPLAWEAGEDPFVDPGAEVDDPNEVDPVTIGADDPGVVNVNALGQYTLVYNYSNLGQDAPTVTRTVHVVDTTPPVITLVGDSSVTAEAGEPYIDEGATADDSFEGDLSGSIVVTNPVNTGVPGVYTVRYNVSDSSGNAAAEVTRTVTVEDTIPPVITLVGDADITAEAGEPFTDPGATALDAFEGDLTTEIVVTGSVDTSTLGTYQLSYNVSDSSGNAAAEVIRTVTVEDTTPPVITLTGSEEITIAVGDSFSDPGATAVDSFEGDLTASIVVSGSVDTNSPGTYTLRYNVSDSSGNAAAEVTRTIFVEEDPLDPRDINRDGVINAVDVQLVINGALGLPIGDFNADVNNDGAVNAVDVQLVINGALGL